MFSVMAVVVLEMNFDVFDNGRVEGKEKKKEERKDWG